jgi:long-chain-fatty-acid--CoA ligase ACSBG
MISHDNITFTSRYLPVESTKMKPFDERVICYLPLSHIAAQICDLFTSLHVGSSVYFAQPDALRGSLNQTMKEVKPTFFLGVPRVWEKMQETIQKGLGALPPPAQAQFGMLRKGVLEQMKKLFMSNLPQASVSPILAKFPMLAKIHSDLGLEQCRNFFSGAAPISRESLEFFISLGIPLCEAYGLSETTGPHSNGYVSLNRIGSIGPVGNVNETKIVNKEADGSGEICMYGRHIFMGYLNAEQKTKESIDEEGWFRSGDVAKIEDGFAYITGRIKEIIITAGGENVSPVPIEENLKSVLPNLISSSMVVGDKQKFLSILVTLKTVPNPETTLPTDNLMPEAVQFLSSLGSKSTKLSDIVDNKDPIVYKAIEEGLF